MFGGVVIGKSEKGSLLMEGSEGRGVMRSGRIKCLVQWSSCWREWKKEFVDGRRKWGNRLRRSGRKKG